MANQSDNAFLPALHYLFSHTDGKIVAHCLDLDLVTSGSDLRRAEDRLNAVVLAQIGSCYSSGNFGQLRVKAPAEYWNVLSDADELARTHLEVDVPPIVLPVERRSVSLPVYRHEKKLAAAA